MAGFRGVAAVGRSVQRLLAMSFDPNQGGESPVDGEPVTVALVRTNDLDVAHSTEIQFPALTVLLYRIDFDKVMRASWSTRGAEEGRAFLPLDLHYLVTAWAENADHEHRILGRALQVLESVGMLSGPLLDPVGGWAPDESVQLVLEDLSTDDLMRTFEALGTDFRLSVPYLARVVVVTGADPTPPPRITTVRTVVPV